ncbi:MAG: hypothetical protein ACSLE6_02100 [Mycobacterium sp.]
MPAGVFFIAIALFQLIWALLVNMRQTPALLAAGILANLGAAVLWALSRTSGPPFGPHAGQPEAVDTAGICTLMLQSYIVMAAGWLWYRRHHAEPISRFSNASLLLTAATVIAFAATAGIASGLMDNHHTPDQTGIDHHPVDDEHNDVPHPHPTPGDSTQTHPDPGPTTPISVEPHSPATEITDPAHESTEDHLHPE